MSGAAYLERKTIKDALPEIGKLTMWLWAWGLMMLLTLFCRALFGSLDSAVGWIPWVNKVVQKPIHRIEQKVSNYIGGAVSKIDGHIATSFHKLAGIVRDIPGQLLQQAALLLTLAAAVVYLPTQALVRHMIRAVTVPLGVAVHDLENVLGRLRAGLKRLDHFARHSIWARLAALAALVGGIAHDLPNLRARDRAIEKELARLRDWVKGRKFPLTTGAFLGAFAWALHHFGLKYLRCSRSKAIQKELCTPKGDWLLSLLEGGLLLVGTISIVELAEALQAEMKPAVDGITGLIREKTG